VTLVASYGGLQAIRTVLGSLPPFFSLPVVVLQHRAPKSDFLAPLLAAGTALRVVEARSGDRPERGVVRVCPAAHEATVDLGGRLLLRATEEHVRADRILEAVSCVHRERAIAVVLTGRGDDGAAGVREIKRRGGRVLVQDPATAAAAGMPRAAVATGCVDLVLPLDKIAPALVSIAMVPGGDELFRVRLTPWAAVDAG
jgi:two-component system chemotaxis response regulator CheB